MRRSVLVGDRARVRAAFPAAAQDSAITNATVALGTAANRSRSATVVVRGGQVEAAGAGDRRARGHRRRSTGGAAGLPRGSFPP